MSVRRSTMEVWLCELANKNFKRDMPSRLKKLGEEFAELAEAIARGESDHTLEECADCSFVLMDIAQLAGGSLTEAQHAKRAVILARVRDDVLHKEDRIRKGAA